MATTKRMLAVLVTLFAAVTPRLTHDCGSHLLEGCFCGNAYFDRNDRAKYVVNCTDLHFTNVDMLRVLPEETEALIFVGNNIPRLPWNVFGDLNNLTKLKSIDMSNNGIEEIRGKSYHHVPNVETLILNHNQLKISDDGDDNYLHPRVFSNFVNLRNLHLTNAFADNTDDALSEDLHEIFATSSLPKLFKLHLEQNEIRSFVDPNVFCDLADLHDLHLGDNYIPSMNFNIRCLKRLRFLDLEHNNITRLLQKDLEQFERLAPPYRADQEPLTVDLSRNPFKCDPAVNHLYSWLQTTNVTVRNKDTLECVSNKYGSPYKLKIKRLAEAKHAKVSTAITILLVILVIILISLLAGYVYLSRDKFSKLGPLIEKVTRKVQYTTIESQDV